MLKAIFNYVGVSVGVKEYALEDHTIPQLLGLRIGALEKVVGHFRALIAFLGTCIFVPLTTAKDHLAACTETGSKFDCPLACLLQDT